MEIASYITGFIDGEGSFLVSFSIRPKLKIGIEARPSFTVSQHERSKTILEDIQRFFGCGSIRFDAHDQTYEHRTDQGIRQIMDLAYQMNNLGARRYTKEDLLRIVSKMKV